jgi:hypothetical protein
VAIELNGNDVTTSGTDAAVKVGKGAELVISDAKGSGVISSTSTQAPAVEVAGTVTLDGATVTSSSNDGIKVAAGLRLRQQLRSWSPAPRVLRLPVSTASLPSASRARLPR